ncbi:MAG: DUF349 domain-containing protein [Bacteroidia bacterium]|nr:DUF349 domain-containing protein [Bacteroidia bacterium]
MMNQELENVNPETEVQDVPVVESSSVEATEPATTEPAAISSEITLETIDNHTDETEHELDVVEELPDFSSLPKEDLLQAALKAAAEKEVDEAISVLKAIRPVLEHHLQEEQATALSKFLEDGGEKDNFEFRGDGTREKFNEAFRGLKQKKEEAKRKQEEEKMANLRKKEAILDEIKKLNETEESEGSLAKIRELQSEWKKIKHVPKEHIEPLWERYRILLDIFYDRLSIYNELKDLDRAKNLDHKIELLAQVSRLLAEETSIKKMLISVKKFQEEWRNIGPVAKDASEDIWNRFKAEVDKVYDLIKSRSAEIEAERHANLEAKKELLAKAKELSAFKTVRTKEWMEKSTFSNELMEQWKKIGHVPMAVRDSIWNEFREARNTFYSNKNQFFKTMHAERNANLKAKEVLCERAESISANPIDWAKQTEELKKLQEDWKKIGPAPDKVNDAVWKRFRTACDSFFAKKAERYASVKEEQTQNLEAKKALIARLENLLNTEVENAFPEMKQIQSEWNAIGFVPMGQKDAINKQYNELLDKLYGKYKQLNRDMRQERDRENFEMLASSPNGNQKLQREEKVLLERIRNLKKDIETWDNNLGFFKSGNGKNPMAEQIHSKIEIAQKHIKGLEEKLKVLRDLKQNAQ